MTFHTYHLVWSNAALTDIWNLCAVHNILQNIKIAAFEDKRIIYVRLCAFSINIMRLKGLCTGTTLLFTATFQWIIKAEFFHDRYAIVVAIIDLGNDLLPIRCQAMI